MKTGIIIFLSFILHNIQAQIINTFAGNGTTVFSGDGGPATLAGIKGPGAIAFDNLGNTYVTDGNYYIRKIDNLGNISTVAGNGSMGYSGDGGSALAAQISPSGICVDAAGNIYISEFNNNRVRKVNTSGIISTVAGNGGTVAIGDGGPATSATLNRPMGIRIDATGNLLITEMFGSRIRKVNTSGIISTIAGNGTSGYSGDGGPATSAKINGPNDVHIDASGNIYIAESWNHCVRKINSSGIISTFAGIGVQGNSGDGGPAMSAMLSFPMGLSSDVAGNLYIGFMNDHRVRKVDSFGTITTIAGIGTPGYTGDGGSATSAQLNSPEYVAINSYGDLLISCYVSYHIRIVQNPTSIGKTEKDIPFVSIYPNPNNGSFTIKGIETETILISNQLGQEVKTICLSDKNNFSETINDLETGVYFLNGKNTKQKIVVID